MIFLIQVLGEIFKEIILHKAKGTWRWAESHGVAEYTNWCHGQPNNDEHHCVFKSFENDYPGWHDYACDLDNWRVYIHALCEGSGSRLS